MTSSYFIAVHAGAGYHSRHKEKDYKLICKLACKKAVEALKQNKPAVDCVTEAVKCLEDSPLTNAGTGSSLTLSGTVECDASCMDGKSLLFGAVGCVSGIKHPSEVAMLLLQQQQKGNLSLGRLPPSVLVGEGACAWARENGLKTTKSEELITESSRFQFQNHKRKLQLHEERMARKRKKYLKMNSDSTEDRCNTDLDQGVQDTVGAIAMDSDGCLAAAVSSGGISLKQPGRIGPAATYGAGCWAYNWKSTSKPGVAVATSGSGEHLMRTLLAKECAACIQREENASLGISQAFKDHFLESEFLHREDEKLGGVLALKQEELNVEVLWGHTTESMCLGFMSSRDQKPKVVISRLPTGSIPGKSFKMEGRCVL